ncbi:DnaD domain-containing protein [Ornithinibacillus halotolerans]|uniref:DnaB/C C-terminal domain-containing protein n=1 Tax=Ornithinibacillus halotolerans TaxID=1274357 RepID=A0A916WDV2_9BACI|nr:DnaD domain protein [Ornithinibacillus halotolerans]GGA91581.1 hypothetical protein GCM10008025_37600 [Ornithinibacillus halotolerans]
MNYIKEINAFYDLVEREPLSASAVSLWNTLLHINNKAAWAEAFTVPGMILKVKAGLTDSSFKRARKELVERGLIEHESRGSNLAPVYKMKRIHLETGFCGGGAGVEVSDGENTCEARVEPHVNDDANHCMNHSTDLGKDPLIKQENTKQNPTTLQYDAKSEIDRNESSRVLAFYGENFGLLTPFVAEDIMNWVDDLGEELVLEGMKRAIERAKYNFGYVKGILNSWVKQGITSVEVLRERERKEGMVSGRAEQKKFARSDEVVPDWFWERKKSSVKVDVVDDEDEKDAGEMLREYLEKGVV